MAVRDRTIFWFLAGTTALTAVITGLIAHLIDRTDFPTFGTGVWWAIVTLATVGYGDVVPHTAWGRVLGSVVIIFGVTFLSILIAMVTSVFIDANRAEFEEAQAAKEDETQGLLRSMDQRLAVIEGLLGTKPGPTG